ncbi:hypothetical protein M378DRAFT_172893 [Amanita muscaria Koide BX008]|uniref:Uncharacterized protein n=1 Tax=Amanita muscaria (strain Koide BX008) TaxID=946122 RepID=A0A0C2W4Y0_AMAMK|nr:hypothetical protein M378DRAFT_172893 [Amanita muscaria Koide BX008]
MLGDIQFPHGDQVHAVLRRPNQRRLSSPEYVRRLNGEEEAHVGRDAYRSAFGTETAYGCCKNQRTIALSKLGPTLIELKRKYKWFVGERRKSHTTSTFSALIPWRWSSS